MLVVINNDSLMNGDICNCCSHSSILQSGSQILAENREFCLPHLRSTPQIRGVAVEYCHNVWYGKLEWRGYRTVKKVEDIFSGFDRKHERDRLTDGQTSHDDIGRA